MLNFIHPLVLTENVYLAQLPCYITCEEGGVGWVRWAKWGWEDYFARDCGVESSAGWKYPHSSLPSSFFLGKGGE